MVRLILLSLTEGLEWATRGVHKLTALDCQPAIVSRYIGTMI